MQRKLTFVIAVGLMGILAFSSAAEAAGAFDIEITGPGLEHPNTIKWDAMAQVVTGPFFHNARRPLGTLGPRYQLRVSTFIPTQPPQPLGVEEWSYYPKVGLVHASSSSLLSGTPWRRPVPALADLFNHAIPGNHPVVTEGARGSGLSEAWEWGLIGGALLLVMASPRFILRRKALGRTTSGWTRPQAAGQPQDRCADLADSL